MPPHLQEVLRRPSVIVLLVANLIPILGVLFFDWDVVSLLKIYWAENVAVGLVNVLKMLTNNLYPIGSMVASKRPVLRDMTGSYLGLYCWMIWLWNNRS